MPKHMNGPDRKEDILKAAMSVAKKGNYSTITRAEVATEASCSEALVSKYFNTMNQLRKAVMRLAAQGGYPEVLAQGLSSKDKQALKANKDERRLAGQTLLGE